MILPLILAAAALAAEPAPVGAPGVSLLEERFLAAADEASRAAILDDIARTPPVSARDVSALFDLFTRFPDPELRRKVMDSLALIPRDSPPLEPLFIAYLRQPEPESQLFGINGAFRLRSRQALPLVRRIASRRFAAADVATVSALSDRNAWWAQYEALSALAQWEGEKALPLLREKAKESPAVARLLARFFWRRHWPDLKAAARSPDPEARARAASAAAAPIDLLDARASRAEMLALVRDPKADDEVRHQLALKAGAVSDDAEVDALLAEHDAAPDGQQRLLWAAAAFASRNPRVVPLLTRYATQSGDEVMRAGARAQLISLLGRDEAEKRLAAPK